METLSTLTIQPTMVKLQWTVNGNSEQDSFVISYKPQQTGGVWVELDSMSGDQHDVPNLHPGEKYSFKIYAISDDQQSDETSLNDIVTG